MLKVGGGQFGSDQVITVSPDGRLLAATRVDDAVEVWRLPESLQGAQVLARAGAPAAVPGVSWVP